MKKLWSVLRRIVGDTSGPELKFVLLTQTPCVLLLAIRHNIYEEFFAWVSLTFGVGLIVLLLMSGFDKDKTAPQFLDLLTQYQNAALLRLAKTALWRSWRTTSFLLILPWTIALMGSRVLITDVTHYAGRKPGKIYGWTKNN